jgi:hypothetical protein
MPSDLELELARRFSGELRFDLYSRILYATDASNYQIEPIGVGFPRTDDDVQYALEVCARHRVPLLARGGGSSLAGQAVGHALILDFSKHLNHIVEINPDEGWAVCEPGVVCDTLSLAAKKYNLMVGTDPASSNRATLGGMVMNNATGAHSVLYGMTADHLIAAEVFLADGAAATFSETDSPPDLLKQVRGVVDGYAEAIRACYPKTWRRSSGYALNYLLPYTATQPHGWDRAKSSIVLFDDTFTNYNHPPVGLAAVRVLAAAGYRPVLVPKVCCGRPMISKGLPEQARANARRNVEVLAPYAERGVPIVGLEPSCLLTLRDEYLDLLPNDPRAKLVAQHSFLIEEFIAARVDEFRPLFNLQSPVSVLFHGHCYQKALTSTEALKAMLRLTGAEVGEIDSGCCGMAGSFGYEVEHYDLSMRIGEERLLPAVRAARTGTILAASGMSCRHQIAAGTNREVKHPIEVMAAFLT